MSVELAYELDTDSPEWQLTQLRKLAEYFVARRGYTPTFVIDRIAALDP